MVEPIGTKLTSASEAVARIAAPTPVSPPAAAPTPRETPTPAALQLTGTAQDLAAAPPVDMERVARIKKAIAEGNFPILPSTIADRLLALRYDWRSDDQA